MDVLLVRSSPYVLPSQRRVDAIVHEGSADLKLWPGRGPDSDLREAWGEGLQEALDAERDRLGGGPVELHRPVRVHPGRLHCDFLVWVPMRPPEPGIERAPAADAAGIEHAVRAVLEFVGERDVGRVAFPALGWGPGELAPVKRLEHIVRAAAAFGEERYRAGKAAGVDQVLVCEPSRQVVRELESRVSHILRDVEEPSGPAREPKPRRAASGRKSGGRGKSARKPKLDADDVARARVTAKPYDMRTTYAPGDWLDPKKFGIGRVEAVTPEGAIMVLFEDGEQRKMVHGR